MNNVLNNKNSIRVIGKLNTGSKDDDFLSKELDDDLLKINCSNGSITVYIQSRKLFIIFYISK